MSKWPMRGHFGHLHFKTFLMTPRTPQFEVFFPLLSDSKHLGVPEDSKSPTLGVWVSSPHLAKVGLWHKLLFTPTKTSSCLEITLLLLFPSFSNYFTSYLQPHYFSLPIQAPPCDIFFFSLLFWLQLQKENLISLTNQLLLLSSPLSFLPLSCKTKHSSPVPPTPFAAWME